VTAGQILDADRHRESQPGKKRVFIKPIQARANPSRMRQLTCSVRSSRTIGPIAISAAPSATQTVCRRVGQSSEATKHRAGSPRPAPREAPRNRQPAMTRSAVR